MLRVLLILWLSCSVGTALAVVGSTAPLPFLSWTPVGSKPSLRQCSETDGPVTRLRGGCASGFGALMDDAKTWNPILLALIGTTFGWFMTALGSAMVVVHKLGLSESSYRKARSPKPRLPPRPLLLLRCREHGSGPLYSDARFHARRLWWRHDRSLGGP